METPKQLQVSLRTPLEWEHSRTRTVVKALGRQYEEKEVKECNYKTDLIQSRNISKPSCVEDIMDGKEKRVEFRYHGKPGEFWDPRLKRTAEVGGFRI
jgi:hypothetical protein